MAKQIIDPAMLDMISGGALGFNAEAGGTFTMEGQFTGKTYSGVSLSNVMEIAKYCATVPNTLEGEQQIIQWAQDQNYIPKD